MVKFIRVMVLLLICSVLLQLIGYYSIGERRIHIVCMKNLKTSAYEVDSVGIYTSIKLYGEEQAEIRNALKFKRIEFTTDLNRFSEHFRHNEKCYGMEYKINNINWFTAYITESNGTLYYGEVWKSRFVWIFFGWVQIRQSMVGVS